MNSHSNNSFSNIIRRLDAQRCGSGYMARCLTHQDHTPSMSICLAPNGSLLVKCFAGCPQDRLIDAFKKLGLWLYLAGDGGSRNAQKKNGEAELKQFLSLQRVWRECLPIIRGSAVDNYLRARGILLKSYPPILKSHPELEYWDSGPDQSPLLVGKFAAMMAAVSASDGNHVCIHRTYVLDGTKAPVKSPKKLMRPVYSGAMSGGAIRLFECGKIIAVAEGIETALAVHAMTGLPVWSTVSADGMRKLILPDPVRELIICADLDESGIGKRAAYALAGRMTRKGLKVQIAIPGSDFEGKGTDWADVLQRRSL